MNTDTVAIIALVVGIVGLVVSVVSLTWQIVQHFLTGSRVAVDLLWGGVGRGGAAVGPIRGTLDPLAREGFAEFVVAVRGRNRGRLPVDVDSFDVEVKNSIAYSLPGWHLNPATPHRLEPGSKVTFYVPLADVQAAIHASEAIHPYEGVIRGRLGLSTGTQQTSPWTKFPPS